MSAAEKRVTEWALETEIKAVASDLRARLPRDNDDVRIQHLALCRSALAEVKALEVRK